MDGYFEIYIATCRPTGKQYVGQTKRSAAERWKNHSVVCKYRQLSEDSPMFSIGDAIRKYGREAFFVEHVASASSRIDAREVESLLIFQRRTFFPHGYNRMLGTSFFHYADQEYRK